MKPAVSQFSKAIVFTVLAGVAIYSASHPQTAPVKTDLTFENILGVLGGLFVLVLLIERATEILISIARSAKTETLKREAQNLSNDPAKADVLASKKTELANFQAETKSIALLIGFSLSVVACAGGIGVLKTIVDQASADPTFMRGIDIVLTSGLLAGGSDSFHQFVRSLETLVQNAKKPQSDL